ncbi:Amidohydrolase [Bacteroidales bacterium WCE2008]|nr:Amidohydrolase [Bacteroidales bacterium WCE2008]
MKTKIISIAFAAAALVAVSCGQAPKQEATSCLDTLLLKDFKPIPCMNLPEHHPHQAKFTVHDMHSHAYAETVDECKEWAERLKANNIDKVVVNTYATGEKFDELYDMYKGVSDAFEMWCGFDMSAWGTPEFEEKAVASLVRDFEKGARGVGEVGDKGLGDAYFTGFQTGEATPTAHMNDPRFDALFEKCGELGMPLIIHVGDPIWMYEKMDEHNDGYPNAETWKIDPETPGLLDLYELCKTLEECCDRHPNTTIIACHFMNLTHDYELLGQIMDRHPNLYLDNSARHIESAITPRATKAFYEKYQDRIFFGTDNYPSQEMYDLQWRILETEDEHFYDYENAYHWALSGIGLSDEVLRKLYYENADKLYEKLAAKRK